MGAAEARVDRALRLGREQMLEALVLVAQLAEALPVAVARSAVGDGLRELPGERVGGALAELRVDQRVARNRQHAPFGVLAELDGPDVVAPEPGPRVAGR